MSGDALPQPPAPTDDERAAAACAWSDHRKDYGESTDPVLLGRDHQNYLAGYHDGRREQRDADKLARSDKHQGTEPANIDALGRLAALDALKRFREHAIATGMPPLTVAEGVTWESGYRAAMRAEGEPPQPLGMLGHWLDYWGSNTVGDGQRVAFAQGYQWREHERFTTTTSEQESTTMPENTEPATWAPHPLPEGHAPETPTMFVHRAIGEALGAASTAWENPAGAGVFDSTKAKTIADGLTTVVTDYGHLCRLDGITDRDSDPSRRIVIIDVENGQWLLGSSPISGDEGARIASSVLPGTTTAYLAAFYDAHMTAPEPAEAQVGELAVAPGVPLAVHALNSATSLHMADAHDTDIDATGNSLASAGRMLAWLRAHQDDDGIVDVEVSSADAAELSDRISTLDQRIVAMSNRIDPALEQLGNLVRGAQTTADTAMSATHRLGTTIDAHAIDARTTGDQVLRAVERAEQALGMARPLGQAIRTLNDRVDSHATQIGLYVTGEAPSGDPGEPQVLEPAASTSFDGLAAGVYIAQGVDPKDSPVAYIRTPGGRWHSSNVENENPNDGARRIYEQCGLTPLTSSRISLGVVGGDTIGGEPTTVHPN